MGPNEKIVMSAAGDASGRAVDGAGKACAGPSEFARRPRLRREIFLALAIKTALLAGLWWAFFSQAPSKAAIARDIGAHLSSVGPELSPASTPGADSFSHKEHQP